MFEILDRKTVETVHTHTHTHTHTGNILEEYILSNPKQRRLDIGKS